MNGADPARSVNSGGLAALAGARYSREGLSVALAVLFICVTTVIFPGEPTFNSEGYLASSTDSLLSLSFYASIRPFVTSLFYKIYGSRPEFAVVGQQQLSVLCWVFLGYAVSRAIRSRLLGMLAILVFASASLSWQILGWTYVMRSESTAFSLFAAWLASYVLYIRRPNWKLFVALCFVTALFGFTKDNIPYFLIAFITCTVLVTLVAGRAAAGRKRLLSVGYGLFIALILVLQTLSASAGYRQLLPLTNLVFKRILTDEYRLAWFKAKGMPVDAELTAWKGRFAWDDNRSYYHPERCVRFKRWIVRKGTPTYALFLITHPGYTFLTAWKDRDKLSCVLVAENMESLDDKIAKAVETKGKDWAQIARYLDVREIRNAHGGKLSPDDVFFRWSHMRHRTADIQMHPAVRVPSILWTPGADMKAEFAYYPQWLLFIAIGLSIVLAGAYVKYPDQLLFLVPVSLIVGSVVNGIVVYHADAAEIERHALMNALGFQVALALGIFLLLDTIASRKPKNPD